MPRLDVIAQGAPVGDAEDKGHGEPHGHDPERESLATAVHGRQCSTEVVAGIEYDEGAMESSVKRDAFLAVLAIFWSMAAFKTMHMHKMGKDLVARTGETVRLLESKESASELDRKLLTGFKENLQQMERTASRQKWDVWLTWILACIAWVWLGASICRRGRRTSAGNSGEPQEPKTFLCRVTGRALP